MNIYEQAVRRKLRFPSSRGLLTVEQLFDLPLLSKDSLNLDAIARQVNSELKDVSEGSFVDSRPNPRKAELELQLEILKQVIATIQAENALKRDTVAKAARKQELLAALSNRQQASLANLSEEEIKKQLADLG